MGCDIHLYLELVETSKNGNQYANSVAEFSCGRDYTMFALMAGVRAYEDAEVLYQPRGLPEEIGWRANYENTLYVTDEDLDGERCASRESAEKWVASGSSQWTDDSHHWVTHPDWHSHSWLTTEEFEQVKVVYEQEEFPREAWYQTKPEIGLNRLPPGATMDDITITLSSTFRSSPYLVEVGPKTKAVFSPKYEALLAAMKALGEGARIVFWFDS